MKTKLFFITFFYFISFTSVVFSQKNEYTVNGTIYAGINELPEGDIFLIRNNRSTYQLSASEKVVNGNFQFKNIRNDQYILYVIPELNYDFLYFPKYLPTYFGNSYSWEKASFSLNKTVLNTELNLLSYENPFYGDKKISGIIKYNNNYKGIQNIPVPVILLNENYQPMDFRIADKHSGKFSFEYLPEGTYYIHPEIPGLITIDYKVIFTHGNSEKNVNFNVDNEKIKNETDSEDITSVISGHYLYLYLDENINSPVVCELIDLSGKSVSKNIYDSNNIAVNTDGLAANIYIVKVKTYDNIPVKTSKVFIKNY